MNTKNKIINPLDKHLDAILRAGGSALKYYDEIGQNRNNMRAALSAAVAELAPASAAPAGDVAMPTAIVLKTAVGNVELVRRPDALAALAARRLTAIAEMTGRVTDVEVDDAWTAECLRSREGMRRALAGFVAGRADAAREGGAS